MCAEAAPGDGNDLGMVQESIQPGGSQQWIGKEVGPFGGGAVGGEQDTALLIAFGNDVVEVLRPGCGQGLEAEIINDEQVGSQISGQTSLESIVGPPAVEMVQHFVSIDEEHVEALDARSMGQG